MTRLDPRPDVWYCSTDDDRPFTATLTADRNPYQVGLVQLDYMDGDSKRIPRDEWWNMRRNGDVTLARKHRDAEVVRKVNEAETDEDADSAPDEAPVVADGGRDLGHLINSYGGGDRSYVVEADGEVVAVADDEVRVYERDPLTVNRDDTPVPLAGGLELRVAIFDYGAEGKSPEVYHSKRRFTEREAAKMDQPDFGEQAVSHAARNVLAEFRSGDSE